MKTIWIMNHHASRKGHRHYELAQFMVSQGMNVVVIASMDNYAEDIKGESLLRCEQIEERFNYVWLKTRPCKAQGSVRRIIAMFSYVFILKNNMQFLVQKYGRPDIVIGSSVHPLVWESAYIIKKKYGAKFICEMRDVWPLSIIEHLNVGEKHPVVVFFDWINKRAFKRCDAMVGTAMKYDQFISDRYSIDVHPYEWIPNGYTVLKSIPTDGKEVYPGLFEYLNTHWCAIFAGSITKSEGVEYLVNAFMSFQKKYHLPISLVIIGEGSCVDDVKQMIADNGLENVLIHKKIKREYVVEVLKQGKVCVATPRISHKLGQYGLSMNKLSDYLWSGTPTLFAYNQFNIVNDAKAGICVPENDIDAWGDALKEIYEMTEEERIKMGERGRCEIKNRYSYEVLGARYIKLIEELKTK